MKTSMTASINSHYFSGYAYFYGVLHLHTSGSMGESMKVFKGRLDCWVIKAGVLRADVVVDGSVVHKRL